MRPSKQILESVKNELRARSITYKEVAEKLGLSESSVKRIFSRGPLSLNHLDRLSEAFDFDLSKLIKSPQNKDEELTILTEIQEKELAANDLLFQVFYVLLDKELSPKKLQERFHFSESKLVEVLLRLERIEVLRLLPGNQIRWRVTRQVRWLPQGPLIKKYGERLRNSFFDRAFHLPDDYLRFIPARLSKGSIRLLHRAFKKLVREYEELHQLDREQPDSDLIEVGLMLAFRPWEHERFRLQ